MGLLDQFLGGQYGADPDQQEAMRQSLLSTGLGLLSSKGSLASALGTAGQQGLQTYQGAQDSALKRKYMKAQLEDVNQQAALRTQQAAREAQKQQWAGQLMGMDGAQPPQQPAPQAMPQPVPQGQPPMPQGQPQGAAPQGQPPQGQPSPQQVAATLPPQVKSRLAAMSEDQIAGAIASGALPKEIIEIWKIAKFGEQMQPNTFRQGPNGMQYVPDPTKGIGFNPQTQQVSQLPGAAAAQAGIAGATTAANEAAKAPYDLVDGFDPVTKAPIKVPKSQVLGMSADSSADPSFNLKGDPAQLRMQLATQIRDPAQRAQVLAAFDARYGQGQQPGAFQTGPSQQDKLSADAGGDINKSWISNSYTPVVKAGDDAQSSLANIQAARTGLSGVGSTGWGKETQVGAARILAAMGVPQADKLASSSQMFQASASSKLLDTLKSQVGVQTEGDAERASKTFAKLSNTPSANQFILDMAEAVATRDAKRAAWYKDALPLGQKSGDLQMIDRKWQERQPSIWSMPSLQKWTK